MENYEVETLLKIKVINIIQKKKLFFVIIAEGNLTYRIYIYIYADIYQLKAKKKINK